jgi:hypothetical protein
MITVASPDSLLSSKPERKCIGWDAPQETSAEHLKFTKSLKELKIGTDISLEQFHKQTEEYAKKEKSVHLFRNYILALTLRDKPKDLQAIVVLGKAHLFKMKFFDYDDDLAASAFLKEKLENNKHENPYAILAMEIPNMPQLSLVY